MFVRDVSRGEGGRSDAPRSALQSAGARPQRRKSLAAISVCVALSVDGISRARRPVGGGPRAWWPVVDMSVPVVRGARSGSLDHLDFQERRQLIASSLSLTDFLHVGAKEVAAVAGQCRIPNNSRLFTSVALCIREIFVFYFLGAPPLLIIIPRVQVLIDAKCQLNSQRIFILHTPIP